MNTNPDPQKERSLDQIFKQWTVETPLPPRFQEQVWQRIARAEAKPQTGISFLALVRQIVELSLSRPRFAYSYVAILVLLGAVSGVWAAQRQSNRLNADLGSRYVQSVDPYYSVASGQ